MEVRNYTITIRAIDGLVLSSEDIVMNADFGVEDFCALDTAFARVGEGVHSPRFHSSLHALRDFGEVMFNAELHDKLVTVLVERW